MKLIFIAIFLICLLIPSYAYALIDNVTIDGPSIVVLPSEELFRINAIPVNESRDLVVKIYGPLSSPTGKISPLADYRVSIDAGSSYTQFFHKFTPPLYFSDVDYTIEVMGDGLVGRKTVKIAESISDLVLKPEIFFSTNKNSLQSEDILKISGTVENFDKLNPFVEIVITRDDGKSILISPVTLDSSGYFEKSVSTNTFWKLNGDYKLQVIHKFTNPSNRALVLDSVSTSKVIEFFSNSNLPVIKITPETTPVVGGSVTFTIEIINLNPSERQFTIFHPITKYPITHDMSVDRPVYSYPLNLHEGFSPGLTYDLKVTYLDITEIFPFTPSGVIDGVTVGLPSTKIQFSLDKSNYSFGDNIAVTGAVEPYIPNKLVRVEVKSSSGLNALTPQNVDVNPDGTFSTIFPVSPGTLKQGAQYTLSASYVSSNNQVEKTFQYGFSTTAPSNQNMPETTPNPIQPSQPTQSTDNPSSIISGVAILLFFSLIIAFLEKKRRKKKQTSKSTSTIYRPPSVPNIPPPT